MGLLRWIVQRKVFIILVTVLVVILGIYTFMQLEKELTPAVSLDAASIDIEAGDMNIKDVEKEITDPVEQQLQAMDGIKEISSTTSSGSSSLQVTFNSDKGDELFREAESKTNSVLQDVSGIEQINATQEGTASAYEFILDISGGDKGEMTAFAEDIFKPRLEEMSEVREVRLTGLKEHKVDIHFDSEKMRDENVTMHEAAERIEQENSEESMGEITAGEDTASLRWDTSIDDVDELKQMQIPKENGHIQLDDIAEVSIDSIESAASTWKNGTDNLVLAEVGRTDDVSQSEMTEAVRDEIKQIEKEGLTDGLSVNEVVAHADFVNNAIDDVTMNILIGGVIAIVVLLLFLRNARATFIVGLSIPTSILLTMIAMGLLDYTINLLTLIGLGLGIGMMVDSAIVIMEAIYSKKEQGYPNLEAVLAGIKEVATAVMASALTTIAAFLPIGFIGGDSGKLMLILAIVVAMTLISSVIIAFTLIPTLADRLIERRKQKENRSRSVFLSYYQRIVSWCIRKKSRSLVVITLFLLVFASSLFLIPKIPMNVMPDMFNRYTEIALDVEEGVSHKEKEDLAEKVHDTLSSVEDVKADYVLDLDDTMMANIVMTKGDRVTEDQDAVTDEALLKLRDLEETEPVRAVEKALDGVSGYPVQVHVSGDDYSNLQEVTHELQEKIASIDGIVGVTNTGKNEAEIQTIQLDEDNMKAAGLTDLEVKETIQQFMYREPIGTVEWDNEILRMEASLDNEPHTKESLLQTNIQTRDGEQNLSAFVDLTQGHMPDEIDHKDGERYMSILADVEGKDLGAVNRDVKHILDQYEHSSDYSLSLAGDLKEQDQLAKDILFVFGIAVFLVFAVMAVQFNHFGQPLLIMSVIPVTVTGIILGLFVTQAELNIMSGLGLIILVGIVLNNAILIIDRTNKLRKEGAQVVDALIQAGETRVRPIFMTTMTTIGAMLPLAFATGMSADYQAPLAIVIISGLSFSTLITLLLIPAVYRVFSKG